MQTYKPSRKTIGFPYRDEQNKVTGKGASGTHFIAYYIPQIDMYIVNNFNTKKSTLYYTLDQVIANS